MERRIFTMILVVIVGVLAGVGIVSKQARDPLLRQLLQNQNDMIKWQNKVEDKIVPAQNLEAVESSRISNLIQTQQSLETRIAALEATVNRLQQAGGNVPPAGPPPEDFSKVYDLAVAHSPIKGNKNAPVTIVEFIDFQCPFCARFHAPMNEVLKAYPKNVKLMVKNFPLDFHPEARPAAKAAFAAGEQGKYWDMVDALLENGQALSETKYSELAGQLGLNVDRFLKDFKEKNVQWEDYIEKDIALGIQANVRGTPTFYINGRKTNARDFGSLKNEIDQILNSN
jgi:protein-disulfide isomerase